MLRWAQSAAAVPSSLEIYKICKYKYMHILSSAAQV